jgi:hypothetical protein
VIAAEVGESECVLVEHLEETVRDAAVLDIRLSGEAPIRLKSLRGENCHYMTIVPSQPDEAIFRKTLQHASQDRFRISLFVQSVTQRSKGRFRPPRRRWARSLLSFAASVDVTMRASAGVALRRSCRKAHF